MFGLGGGLGGVVGALLKLWTVPLAHAATATPASRYRNDRQTSIGLGLAVGLALGLLVGLVVGLMVGLGTALLAGLMFGLIFGLMFGLLFGSVPKVSFTELVLATTGAGRVKFMRVLEDAHHRQVLRQAGAVYQFRHAELQDHLAEIHRRHTRTPDKSLSTVTTKD